MLKKNISTSNKLAALKSDSSRMLYVWLLPHLDIEGLYSADPDIIKGYVLTKMSDWDRDKINLCLQDLKEVGLINLYSVGNEKYLEYPDFKKYQILRKDREAQSEIRKLLLDNSKSATGELPPKVEGKGKGKVEDKENKEIINNLPTGLKKNSTGEKLVK